VTLTARYRRGQRTNSPGVQSDDRSRLKPCHPDSGCHDSNAQAPVGRATMRSRIPSPQTAGRQSVSAITTLILAAVALAVTGTASANVVAPAGGYAAADYHDPVVLQWQQPGAVRVLWSRDGEWIGKRLRATNEVLGSSIEIVPSNYRLLPGFWHWRLCRYDLAASPSVSSCTLGPETGVLRVTTGTQTVVNLDGRCTRARFEVATAPDLRRALSRTRKLCRP